MDKTVSVAQAQKTFSDLIERVIDRHERIIVSKRGKAVGAIVGTADLKRLQEIEKQEIVEKMRAIEKRTKKYIPYEEFVRNYEKKWGVKLDEIPDED
ncbi:MAG: type II toxin-antitoxin system Phd/YefM family antitoxin [Chloroflexi bacterium]|nr:type II toxin-antitoxin system Phd/YefM family antitoxin [Chloroflexota bacterium]